MLCAISFVSFLAGAALTGVLLLRRKLNDISAILDTHGERILDLEKEVY